MQVKDRLYKILISRVPGINVRYQQRRDRYSGHEKVKAWIYLFWLNTQYYVLRNRKIGEVEGFSADIGKKVIIGSESLLYKREDPREYADELKKYDVISFDIFDTLILRRVAEPLDVFYLMQSKIHYPNLRKLRNEAEKKAREYRHQEAGDYEVNLEEIWESLSKSSGIRKDEGMRMEVEAEKALCYGNPYFLEVIKHLKSTKSKIIVCSDMYLSKEEIQDLLCKCGYPEFDGYYISGEYRKSKGSGLYKEIKSDFGSDKNYIHIGDNKYSDIDCARRNGFSASYYPNTQQTALPYRAQDMDPLISSVYSGIVNGYLHCGIFNKSAEFEFGFIYGGLFVVGFCQFIKEYVNAHSIDKILFLARDGEILEKAYKYLYPEDESICKYVYWSRLASTKMSASIFKAHYIERMIIHKIGQGYRLKDIFATMAIEDLLDRFLEEHQDKGYTATSPFNERESEDLQHFLDTCWDSVCQHYHEEVEEGKKYFLKILEGCRSAVAIDVGWVGSGIITLKCISRDIWGLPCEINGIVAGTCGGTGLDYEATLVELDDGSICSYLFSPGDNRDIWKQHDPGRGHNMLVELLLSSTHRSFRGFKMDSQGYYSFNDERETINAIEIQNGIMQFVKMFNEHPFKQLKVTGRDAAAPLALLYENPEFVDDIIKRSGIESNIV